MKIRHQSALILIALSLLGSLAICLLSLRALRGATREQLTERVRSEAGLLADSLALGTAAADLQEFALGARRRLGVRVTLIDGDGVVLADSSLDRRGVEAMENHGDRPEVVAASREGSGEGLRFSASTGVEYFYHARRIEGHPGVRFVRLALPSSRLEHVAGGALASFWAAVVAIFLAHAGVATLLVRRLSIPMEHLASGLDRAGPDAAAPLPYEGGEEHARLASAINRMKQAMDERVEDLQQRGELLAAAVSDMRDGLVVVGPDRKILLANEAFRNAFQVPFDPAGRLLAHVVRSPAVLEALDGALGEGGEIQASVLQAAELGRTFQLHVTPLKGRAAGAPAGAAALILFFDITRLETLENVRREFVANVSHELRTPLTSIKAFVETLLEEGLEDREHGLEFLGIVRRHVGRMEMLVEDLTDLSLIETGSVELEVHEIDVCAVAAEVIEQLGHRNRGMPVQVENRVPSPFLLHADRRRLEQILVNLVDNAMKFNRPGGSVRVTASRAGGVATITVEDTGVGIPPEGLEKVFHRFYRVDRARSREVGGTGLGLSIVKHLMRLHGGSVRVESRMGQGSRFLLEFPDASQA